MERGPTVQDYAKMLKSLASFGKSDIEEIENIYVNSSASQIVPSTLVATKLQHVMIDQNIS